MLPTLGGAPPFWTWGAKEAGIDAFHHPVYAVEEGVGYALLDRQRLGHRYGGLRRVRSA